VDEIFELQFVVEPGIRTHIDLPPKFQVRTGGMIREGSVQCTHEAPMDYRRKVVQTGCVVPKCDCDLGKSGTRGKGVEDGVDELGGAEGEERNAMF
jgi:hypothetical protein